MTRDELIERMARAVWDTRGYVHSSEDRMFEPLEYGEEGEYAPAQAICQDAAKSALSTLCAALPGLSDVIDGKAVIVPVEARPLNWQETYRDRGDGSSELSGWEAEGFGEWYCIEQYFGTDSYGWQVKYSMDVIGDYDDPDTAKAAAQRDCASKALSALTEKRPK